MVIVGIFYCCFTNIALEWFPDLQEMKLKAAEWMQATRPQRRFFANIKMCFTKTHNTYVRKMKEPCWIFSYDSPRLTII